jgi:molybdopterin-guanine dinucleotide biosynthesis protein A
MNSTARRADLGQVPLSAIILAGGRSSRMGQDKATLMFGDRPLLVHVLDSLRPLAPRPLLVLAAPEQALPVLGAGVAIVRDDAPFDGPLAALAKGLTLAAREGARIFVAATDLLHLQTAVVRRIVELAGRSDAAIPFVRGVHQPLCAVYSPRAAEVATALVRDGARSMKALRAALDVRVITEHELLEDAEVRASDPELSSFRDADVPEDLNSDRGRS